MKTYISLLSVWNHNTFMETIYSTRNIIKMHRYHSKPNQACHFQITFPWQTGTVLEDASAKARVCCLILCCALLPGDKRVKQKSKQRSSASNLMWYNCLKSTCWNKRVKDGYIKKKATILFQWVWLCYRHALKSNLSLEELIIVLRGSSRL